MKVREARAADFVSVKAMLSDAGLPTEDFVAEHLAFVAEDNGRVVAAVGFQRFGNVGLLRSLVVEEGTRFKGLGRDLVIALEAQAREQGVREIWLLTSGVDAYFVGLGYETRDRSAAPPAIRGTAEFDQLCPDDATLMAKNLG
jgi:amino-acid N-acetyltransferase